VFAAFAVVSDHVFDALKASQVPPVAQPGVFVRYISVAEPAASARVTVNEFV